MITSPSTPVPSSAADPKHHPARTQAHPGPFRPRDSGPTGRRAGDESGGRADVEQLIGLNGRSSTEQHATAAPGAPHDHHDRPVDGHRRDPAPRPRTRPATPTSSGLHMYYETYGAGRPLRPPARRDADHRAQLRRADPDAGAGPPGRRRRDAGARPDRRTSTGRSRPPPSRATSWPCSTTSGSSGPTCSATAWVPPSRSSWRSTTRPGSGSVVAASASVRPDGMHEDLTDPAKQATSTRMPTPQDFNDFVEAYNRLSPHPEHFQEFLDLALLGQLRPRGMERRAAGRHHGSGPARPGRPGLHHHRARGADAAPHPRLAARRAAGHDPHGGHAEDRAPAADAGPVPADRSLRAARPAFRQRGRVWRLGHDGDGPLPGPDQADRQGPDQLVPGGRRRSDQHGVRRDLGGDAHDLGVRVALGHEPLGLHPDVGGARLDRATDVVGHLIGARRRCRARRRPRDRRGSASTGRGRRRAGTTADGRGLPRRRRPATRSASRRRRRAGREGPSRPISNGWPGSSELTGVGWSRARPSGGVTPVRMPLATHELRSDSIRPDARVSIRSPRSLTRVGQPGFGHIGRMAAVFESGEAGAPVPADRVVSTWPPDATSVTAVRRWLKSFCHEALLLGGGLRRRRTRR